MPYTNVAESTSVPEKVPISSVNESLATVSSKLMALGVPSVGESFIAAMETDTVATPESNAPSFTLKVNESLPVSFKFGV